jgi:hypothetical protein
MPLTETQAECLSPLSLTDLLTNRVGCDAVIRALMGVRSQLHQMPLKDQSDVEKEMSLLLNDFARAVGQTRIKVAFDKAELIRRQKLAKNNADAKQDFHSLIYDRKPPEMIEIKRTAKPTKPLLPRSTARGLVALWVAKCERENQRRFQFKFFCDFVESQWLGGEHEWHAQDLEKGEANSPRWRVTAQSALQDERNIRVAWNKTMKVWSIL